MIIRKAKSTDVNDLKTLYFEYLTHFPPKEEQEKDLFIFIDEWLRRTCRNRSPVKIMKW